MISPVGRRLEQGGDIAERGQPPLVSVVIPTYNRCERLAKVLTALAAQEGAVSFEVVVVSDGSTDGTDEYLAFGRVPLPIIAARQPNQGPAAARNRGIDLASGDIVLFIDDDVVAAPQLLARHAAGHCAAEHDDLVVIGPMLNPADFEMSPWVRYEQAMLQKQYDAMIAGEWAPTARQFYTGNASIRRAHLLAVGGFDPQFRRLEDVELAYRLDDRGLRWSFDPEAVGWHYAERSFDAWLATARAYGRNEVVFGRDHGRSGVLATMVKEYPTRHVLVRGLVRVGVGRPRLAALMNGAVRRAVSWRWFGRRPRLAQVSLSAAYNLSYYQGVADELGGARSLRDLLAVRR